MTEQSGDKPAVPLTRRQLREQAARAAAASSAAPASPAQSAAAPGQRAATTPQGAATPGQRAAAPPASQAAVRRPGTDGTGGSRAASPLPSRTPQPTGPGSQFSRVGRPRTQQEHRQPSPVAAPTPDVSRRALRERVDTARPVVVPPTQTSSIRTVDETGELSVVRDVDRGTPHGSTAAPRTRAASAAAQPAARPQPAPARVVPQQAGAAARPATPARPAPATPWPAAPTGAQQTAQPQQTAPQQQAAPSHQTALPQRVSAPQQAAGAREPAGQRPASPGMLGDSPARRPWPPVAPTPPGASGTPDASVASAFHQRISAPMSPAGSPTTSGSSEPVTEMLPRWDAVAAGGAELPGTPALRSPASSGPADEPDERPSSLTPGAAADDEDLDDDDEDDEDDEGDHRYTWLHCLILVAVAFVLGLIIWKVGLEGRGGAVAEGSAASSTVATHVSPHPSPV